MVNTKVRKGKKQVLKNAKGKTDSSRKWIERRINDPFVMLAKQEGYRSRAAYKLLEILKKVPIEKRNIKSIVDLGCAPGGWLQVLKVQFPKARIVGIDLQSVEPIEGIEIITGDFMKGDVFEALSDMTGTKVELIVSDMAANSVGNKDADHLRISGLIEMAFEFCKLHLANKGVFICKLLRGAEEVELVKMLRKSFASVKFYKPESSYQDSSEVYLLCTGYSSL